MTNPSDSGPFDPSGYEQSLLESMGPIIAQILEFEHELIQSIVQPLAEVESNLNKIDADLGNAIASYLAPSFGALSIAARDVQTQIDQHLVDAAANTGLAVGEPQHLTELKATPLPGTYNPFQPTSANTGPPRHPIGVPVMPPQPAPPPIPRPLPPSPPRYPVFPQQPPPTFPVRFPRHVPGPTPVTPYPPGLPFGLSPATEGGNGGGSGGGEPGCCDPPEQHWESDGTGWACSSDGYVVITKGSDFTGDQIPPNCAINNDGNLVCHYGCDESPNPPLPPTPTPPGEPPGGPPPGEPPGGPTPTPTPTPTPPTPTPPGGPTPTPTPTPGCPPPGAPPLPPGWCWQMINGYCQAVRCGPPPPTPPPQPPSPPQPPPTPPEPGVPPLVGGGCGGDRDDPCFIASSSPDSKHPTFNVTTGGTHGILRDKAIDLSVDPIQVQPPNVSPGVADIAGQPVICSAPYTFELTFQGAQFMDVLGGMIDPTQVVNSAMAGESMASKLVKMTIVAPMAAALKVAFEVFAGISSAITQAFGGVYPCADAVTGNEMIFNFLNLFMLGGLRKYKRIMTYANDYNCPIGIPSPAEAAAAWLGGEIDECTFQSYVMAGDYKYPPYKNVAMAGKYKFTALELMSLSKRQKLVRDDLPTRLREIGSLEAEDSQELEALFTQIPGPAELIRYMVRDVENQDVISTFGLDVGFGDNFQGKVKDWAQMQGLTDDQMTREWRAHWDIPSPTQLYEIYRRLRHRDSYPGPDQVLTWVKDALKQQDVLPFWQDKLIDVAFHPLTRTDLNRAYEHGWINDDDYVNGMYELGYNDNDAQTLLKFVQHERKLVIRTADFVRAYAQGYISSEQALDRATDEGFSGDAIDAVGDELKIQRQFADQHRVVDAVAAQYKSCRISYEEAQQEMADEEIPEEVINYQLNIATLHTSCGTRREMQATLANLVKAGEMGQEGYFDRMQRLKYEDAAIENYWALLQSQLSAAQKKAAAKQAEAAKKAAEAATKAAQKAEQQAEKELEKVQKAAAAAERSRQARNKALEDAAFTLGQDLTDATSPPSFYVQGLFNTLVSEIGLSQNEAANVIKFGSTKAKGMSSQQFSAWAMATGTAGLTEPWSLWPQWLSPPTLD